MTTFKFKQFDLCQDAVAMKLGTDAMVLGSWVDVDKVETVLDIGSGTGILALMIAQRSDASVIDAIEIDAIAFETTVQNFENSLWSDRLYAYHTSLQEFMAEVSDKYNLLVCNPPYFKPSKETPSSARAMARHTYTLDFETLLSGAKCLLEVDGSLVISLPYDREKYFLELALQNGLYLNKVLRMRDKQDISYSRSFLQMKLSLTLAVTEEMLILKNIDNTYSNAYIGLTKDFYINF